ncbi:glutamate ABC transporter substrate-binding protein [Microbacterium excoecariae]|uniref:glutamate ABC transporter substrate-binding protein n=1 Tax=Microbacterium excoecariae TaxID=2715210 RepID=UPI00140D4125|nr:glutamate ABC transporter substrate-binding protein [Microbacterium excoecariae]NHI16483.1 glutamate ABC transporter substrate-binding protein [Microbacterium excoecariae]
MRKFRTIAAAGLAAGALFTLTACNSGTPSGDAGDGGDAEAPYEVASDVSLEGSPTYDAMVDADEVTIGVKEDQPGLGYLDATTGERTGFDVEIARWMAASLGFSEDQIDWQAIPSANREQALINGDVDFYVGTYSITDERKQQIDFAGPYFATGQGLLVAADSDIASDADLTSDVTVCSATGSTPIQNIRDNYDAQTEEFDTYTQCVDALLNGTVDAVTTDELILIGYAAQYPDELKIVGEPFSEELYGIGVPKGDDALRDFFNTTLEEGGDTWSAIFDQELGDAGVTPEQPAVDRY